MTSTIKIEAELLLDGSTNDPVKNGSVVFSGEKILFAGGSEDAPAADKTITAKVVMPGLWDAHTHFFGAKTASPAEWFMLTPLARMARATYDAKIALESGFTSIREVGGLGLDLSYVINDKSIPGPNIYAAGSPLGTTGGHADFHDIPIYILEAFQERMWGGGGICDGPWEAVKAVRMQLRKGAHLIKVMASGGVMSKRDNPMHREFSLTEMKAIVEEATAKDRIVAAHTHGAAGIKTAVEAGVKTIEHGTWINDELIETIIEKGVIVVPTFYIQNRLYELGPKIGLQQESIEKMNIVIHQHRENIKRAYKKGVKIALGTDIYSSGPDSAVPWGENAKELEYMVGIGMSPLEAISSATMIAAQTLGPMGPKSGMLKKDYDADILVLKEDPLKDITIFQKKENILGVIKAGELVVDRGVEWS